MSVAPVGADETLPVDRDRRSLWPVILAVAVLLVAVFAGWTRLRSETAYVGSTRRVSLTWECWNAIVWTDPSVAGEWRADLSTSTGTLVTDDGDRVVAPSPRVKHAEGELRFSDSEVADFRSDAGGTITFRRFESGAGRDLSCVERTDG